ncbi:MAG: NADH-quinone oxidoreductase subunit H [Holosporales bacterium]|jgi:NADH-quinone oxidoreductase subunit H|nr:NADH-quinone oxidoreductase subunit H [Holosporales bacterium]
MLLLIRALIFFTGCVLLAAYLSLYERKLIGRIQLRCGPNQCGIGGLLQPFADTIKICFKRSAMRGYSRSVIFAILLLFFISLLQLALIPITSDFVLWNPRGSIFIVILLHTIVVFSETLIGVSSHSKYGVIGGVRAYLQAVASSVPYILSLIVMILIYDSINIFDIMQAESKAGIILQIPLLIAYFITLLMVCNKIPFDLPEAESELVAGAYVEYGGILFGLIYLSDYLNLMFQSALLANLFLGRYIVIYTFMIITIVILIRAILPRYKQAQMLRIAWITLSPIWLGLAVLLW